MLPITQPWPHARKAEFLRFAGAGEGIRTLDPNLGKVYYELECLDLCGFLNAFQGVCIIRVNSMPFVRAEARRLNLRQLETQKSVSTRTFHHAKLSSSFLASLRSGASKPSVNQP